MCEWGAMMADSFYGGKDPRDLPLYSYAEVGRWLRMPASTVRDKIKASRPAHAKKHPVTFFEMYDLWNETNIPGNGEFTHLDAYMDTPIIYHPGPGVDINTRVSFGRPCLGGTGTKTSVVAARVEAGETPQEVADDYDLPLKLIEAAVAFEASMTPPGGTEGR